MHPAKEGFSALPFFDEFDLSTVDILLISQYVKIPSAHSSSRRSPRRNRDWPYCICLYGVVLRCAV